MMLRVNRREFLVAGTAAVSSIAFPTLSFSRSAPARAKVVRTSTDRFELILPEPEKVRILQLSDTHFGKPNPEYVAADPVTRKLIRTLVDENTPDLVFHTGDFINNDTEYVDHSAIGFMNSLGTPWSVVFGNHDHPDNAPRNLTLDECYARFQNHATGYRSFNSGTAQAREYCFRIDIKASNRKPVASLFGFNTGGVSVPEVVSPGQMAWFSEQMEADRSLGHNQPILVMQHIPMIQYKTVFDEKKAIGRQGEGVASGVDKGEVFEAYRASGRVKGVFCGHDHVNDYIGDLQGIKLVYGRVTGWSGYGDWERGGRMITFSKTPSAFRSRVVLPKGVIEKPEWSKTMADL
jgi:3',5'-cyclic AMP phosphodiesterase CpdA